MLASGLTEGIGIILLVPMLGVLTGAGGVIGGLGAFVHRFGVPVSLGPLLALFVALVILRALIVHARSMVGARLQADVVDALRRRAWSALLHCDWRALSAMNQADNASLLITNIDRVGLGLHQGLAVASNVATLAGVGLAALAISPGISIGAALGGVLVLFAYRGMRRRAALLGEQLGAAYGRVYGQIHEGLGALRVIKSFGREQRSEVRLLAEFAGVRRAELAYVRDMGLGQIALQGGGALVLAVLVWLAITRWQVGAMTVLPMVALFARALPLLGGLQEAWQSWEHARPAFAATRDLIAQAEAAREPDFVEVEAPRLADALVLDGVTVRFDGRAVPALDRVSLSLSPRGLTALVGPSGAGKSTLADLLGGLISPDEGMIAVDGAALEGALRRAWRGRVAYVQQEPVLFSGTLRNNLLWAMPEATDAQLWQAIGDASAGFINELPLGLDAPLGEGGRQLSGGERQRIVLARALLRDPALLILDEATSALDAANEAAIVEALARLKQRMAVVVICHRGALVDIADRIVTMEGGQIRSVRDAAVRG